MTNMLRKTIIVGVIGSALALGGCAGGIMINPFTKQPITAADVQAAAVAACGFLPTASTVANILSNNSGTVQSAEQIASLICGAVTPKAGKLRGLPMVNGVVIHGRFVN
jgi:hypothetical protein